MDNQYTYPDIGLLDHNEFQAEDKSDSSQKLEEFLKIMGVSAKVVSVDETSISTTYALQLAPGVRINKVTKLTQEISVALQASDIQFQIPIPGTSYLGIQAIKSDAAQVLLGDFIQDTAFIESDNLMEVVLGRTLDGKTAHFDFNETPHLLISGTTGSGKSVFIDSIILNVIYKASPDEVRFLMIDTHGINLSSFSSLPHLLTPVLTNVNHAVSGLNYANKEMDNRYRLFADMGVKNIDAYNDIIDSTNGKKLPRIIIVIDDFADLMAFQPAETEETICRLSQMSRAAGIHLLISTQRPSVNILTGQIKANMPNRIAFRTAASVDSRTILDVGGAEHLLGKGDMLLKTIGQREPIRIQAPYVSDAEISRVVRFIADKNPHDLPDISIIAPPIQPVYGYGYLEENGYDELLRQAGRVVIESDMASIGRLQRTFKIGFNRAAHIMDQLAELGVVGPEIGTKPRTILMTLEEFEALDFFIS
jgi:S-DNA-T family DNA segregation ATPase FtsK/SpoIIIE